MESPASFWNPVHRALHLFRPGFSAIANSNTSASLPPGLDYRETPPSFDNCNGNKSFSLVTVRARGGPRRCEHTLHSARFGCLLA